MHSKKLSVIVTFLFVGYFTKISAQKTNLLQSYIKQYFKDYFPSTIRSYTLYGNGQPGAADFHAGLPFDSETKGKVNSLIYSTASTGPSPKSQAVPKSGQTYPGNTYTYPGIPNSFYPPVGMNQQYMNQQSNPLSRSGFSPPPPQQYMLQQEQIQMVNPLTSVNNPAPVVSSSVGANSNPNEGLQEKSINISLDNVNNENAEVPLQSSLSFSR